MPEVTITIGGRNFEVSCQEGEEHYLKSAAAMLDIEAQSLIEQVGRLSESRVLLMAGLMLADKTAGLEEDLKTTERQLEDARTAARVAASQPAPPPERVEVAVMPQGVIDSMAELAARAEAVADAAEH
jgi:cell division protein ZapA